MSEQHSIYRHNRKVGIAVVERQGLYDCAVCRCSFPQPGRYKIHVSADGKEYNLGLCVPYEDGFGLTARYPTPKNANKPIRFWVAEAGTEATGIFIPVTEDMPFENIAQLRQARFAVRDGKFGVEPTD